MKQLNNFIKMNLSSTKLFDSSFIKDRNIILNLLYDKNATISDTNIFLDSFKSSYIKNSVLNNFKISQLQQENRNLIKEPTDGDVFIDELGNKFRLVNVFDNKFQFCEEGSFYMSSNGYSSMSGGFAFNVKHKGKEIGSITSKELKKIEKKEYRRFWFFKDNSSGAHRGIYFNCEVNVFKTL